MLLPTQTSVAPAIAAITGGVFTVMLRVVKLLPHVLVTVYVNVNVPPETPLTEPVDAFTDAILTSELLHEPPTVALVAVILAPTHTVAALVIAAGTPGIVLTVIPRSLDVEPQIFVTV